MEENPHPKWIENPHTFVCSNRAYKNGDGVGLFISNNLNYKLRSDLSANKDGIIETFFTYLHVLPILQTAKKEEF